MRLALRNYDIIEPTSLEEYIARGGYLALEKALFDMTPEEVLQTVIDANLRGRGGAGFSAGRKWQTAYRQDSDIKYVICNADEGDPGAYMDRSILEGDPHVIIEAMANGSPKTTHTMTKEWINGPADHPTIEVQLMQNGTAYGNKVALANGTTNHEWANLPKTDANGTDFAYTVQEVSVGGIPVANGQAGNYQVSSNDNGTASTITNTYTIPKVDLTGSKARVGGDATHLTISLELLRDGSTITGVDPIELTNGNTDAVWKDLDKTDISGKDYIYTVHEQTVPDGYEASYDGLKVTNTFVGTTQVELTKTWVDDNNSKSTRPAEVTFQAVKMKDGIATGTVFDKVFAVKETPTTATGKYVIDNLPQYDTDGKDFAYEVKEVRVAGYTTSIDQGTKTITNTLTDTTSFAFEKRWIGGASPRPDIEVKLLANEQSATHVDGTAVANSILKDGTLKAEFTNLPTFDKEGKAIVYTIEEVNVPAGYTAQVDGNVITNTYASATQTLAVNKVWDGGDANNRPEIQVQLFRQVDAGNKEFVGEPLRLNGQVDGVETEAWTAGWKDLPIYDGNGKIYTYTVEEINPPAGYSPSVSEIKDGTGKLTGFRVTNIYGAQNADVKAYKKWVGGDATPRPEVYFQLLKNNVPEGAPVLVTDGQVTWQDLPTTDKDAKAITYTIKEVNQDGSDWSNDAYTSKVEDLVATNTYTVKTLDVTANKVWVNGDPASHTTVKLQLYRNGQALGDPISTTDTASWADLPTTDEFGQAYTYTVDELEVPDNYVKKVERTDNVFTITNTFTEGVTSHTVNKNWVGGPDAKPSVQIELYRKVANGIEEKVTDTMVTGIQNPITLPSTNTYTWSNLPSKTNDGQEITYYAKEVGVASDYRVSYMTSLGSTGNSTFITNTYTGITTETVKKIWSGDSGNTAARPAEITLTAVQMKNGVETGKTFDKVVAVDKASNEQSVTFDNLPKQDADGTVFTYTFDEVAVPGYEKVVNGNTITNSLTGKVDIPVEKRWIGGPVDKPEVTIQLAANGNEVTDKILTLNAGNNWKDSFKDLPAFDDTGKTIAYTVKEIPVAGYGSSQENIGGTWIISNTYNESSSMRVNKVWKYADGTNMDPVPTDLKAVVLLNRSVDGGESENFRSVVLDSTNDWQHDFGNLDKYDFEGKAYTYTFAELPVSGYTSSQVTNADGSVTMTNAKNDATTLTVPVVKIWDGGAPSDIKEVTVNITRSVVKNGETLADPSFTQQSTLLNDGNGWRSEFTNLPVADKDGNKYIYDVKEVVPTGYTERYEGGFKCGVVIYNTPSQGDLIINKINPSGEKLVGVDFTLTGITDTTFANTVTSDANGVIIFADLPSGDYELKETKTLPGYGLDKTV